MIRPECAAALIVLAVVSAAPLAAQQAQQAQLFQFVVGATDASGMPVTDLRPADVIMSENGAPAQIVKVSLE